MPRHTRANPSTGLPNNALYGILPIAPAQLTWSTVVLPISGTPSPVNLTLEDVLNIPDIVNEILQNLTVLDYNSLTQVNRRMNIVLPTYNPARPILFPGAREARTNLLQHECEDCREPIKVAWTNPPAAEPHPPYRQWTLVRPTGPGGVELPNTFCSLRAGDVNATGATVRFAYCDGPKMTLPDGSNEPLPHPGIPHPEFKMICADCALLHYNENDITLDHERLLFHCKPCSNRIFSQATPTPDCDCYQKFHPTNGLHLCLDCRVQFLHNQSKVVVNNWYGLPANDRADTYNDRHINHYISDLYPEFQGRHLCRCGKDSYRTSASYPRLEPWRPDPRIPGEWNAHGFARDYSSGFRQCMNCLGHVVSFREHPPATRSSCQL